MSGAGSRACPRVSLAREWRRIGTPRPAREQMQAELMVDAPVSCEEMAMSSGHASQGWRSAISQPERYGLVLILIVADYLAQAVLSTSAWGRVLNLILFGLTLLFTLWTARTRRVWLLLALVYLIISLLVRIAGLMQASPPTLSAATGLFDAAFLFAAMIIILQRIGQ